MSLIRTATNWLDRRGDLITATARIFQLGPLLVLGGVLKFTWSEVSRGVFWVTAAASISACLFYYIAFLNALAANGSGSINEMSGRT